MAKKNQTIKRKIPYKMYARIPYGFFLMKDDIGIGYGEILVLSSLYGMAKVKGGYAVVGNDYLSGLYNIKLRTLRDHLYKLKELGFIDWRTDKQGERVFKVDVDEIDSYVDGLVEQRNLNGTEDESRDYDDLFAKHMEPTI